MAGCPQGQITIDAVDDLSEGCEITWDGLPYPIRNLTGRLELHPDRWVFSKMRPTAKRSSRPADGFRCCRRKLPNGDDPVRVHVDLQPVESPV
jgi:hypothetical protein